MSVLHNSELITELNRIGAISEESLEQFYPCTRDRQDVSVLRCKTTGVLVLSSTDHLGQNYYQERIEKSTITTQVDEVETPRLTDNIRRSKEFNSYIKGKRWLDFGCGLGGMLDEMAQESSLAVGLEPNHDRASICRRKGHKVVSDLNELEDNSFDIVSMFHVLEHISHPVYTLNQVIRKLTPNGVLLVEVPHARDALVNLFECESFKRFTFWSEHLVLHTRQSLSLVVSSSGFSNIYISSYQRYPLANHLYWLAKGKPGGQEKWSFMVSDQIHISYESILSKIDMTDTLICVARKPD